MPEISIAEEAGMSFETRCEEALVSLRRLWELLQNFSAEDLQFRQGRAQRKEAFLAGLSESTRERVAPLVAGFGSIPSEVEEKFYKMIWEGGLQFSREIYGFDATDLALKAMEPERTGN